jgi:hypothetical protein
MRFKQTLESTKLRVNTETACLFINISFVNSVALSFFWLDVGRLSHYTNCMSPTKRRCFLSSGYVALACHQ